MASVFTQDLPRDVADAFIGAGQVACDTETTGLDWRHDRLAICQLYHPSVGLAIVRMTGPAEQLSRVLVAEDLTKVFHHAPFDLRFLTHALGVVPAEIRCTKVASKLLRPEEPNNMHSLAALLSNILDVHLDKGAVRTSDWTGELTDEQLAYAGNDVRFLLPLLDALEDGLREVGRAALFDECCHFLATRVETELLGLQDVFAY
ncbi:hypothetical protein ASC77_12455 [Nocardioides sp. Root1257]|nr:hypothetical protein ASC77_12455 [Nocardioides sp. Root1257]KRC45442.1 hypothetical protein ASE24_12460 [Nocardioides sp. Root224]